MDPDFVSMKIECHVDRNVLGNAFPGVPMENIKVVCAGDMESFGAWKANRGCNLYSQQEEGDTENLKYVRFVNNGLIKIIPGLDVQTKFYCCISDLVNKVNIPNRENKWEQFNGNREWKTPDICLPQDQNYKLIFNYGQKSGALEIIKEKYSPAIPIIEEKASETFSEKEIVPENKIEAAESKKILPENKIVPEVAITEILPKTLSKSEELAKLDIWTKKIDLSSILTFHDLPFPNMGEMEGVSVVHRDYGRNQK